MNRRGFFASLLAPLAALPFLRWLAPESDLRLLGYVDDGTMHPTHLGIDRTKSGNAFWNAPQGPPLSGRDLETAFQKAFDDIAANDYLYYGKVPNLRGSLR